MFCLYNLAVRLQQTSDFFFYIPTYYAQSSQFIIFPRDLNKSRVLLNSVKFNCSFASFYLGLYGKPFEPVSACGSPNNFQISHFYHRRTHCEGYVIEQRQETICTSFPSFRQGQQGVLTAFPMRQNVGF